MTEQLGTPKADAKSTARPRALLMQPALHIALTAVFLGAAPSLIILKILQRYRWIITTEQPTAHPNWYAVGEGIRGRLDDPSFWNLIGLTLATAWIGWSTYRLGASTIRWKLFIGWALCALVLSIAYLGNTYYQSEGYFYVSSDTHFVTKLPIHDPTIYFIQRIEATICMVALMIGPSMLAVGLATLKHLKNSFETGHAGTDLDTLREAAGHLRTAPAWPFWVMTSGVALGSLLKFLLKWDFDFLNVGKSALHILVTLAAIAALFAPFFYLRRRVRRELHPYVHFKKKAMIDDDDLDEGTLLQLLFAVFRMFGRYEAVLRSEHVGRAGLRPEPKVDLPAPALQPPEDAPRKKYLN